MKDTPTIYLIGIEWDFMGQNQPTILYAMVIYQRYQSHGFTWDIANQLDMMAKSDEIR